MEYVDANVFCGTILFVLTSQFAHGYDCSNPSFTIEVTNSSNGIFIAKEDTSQRITTTVTPVTRCNEWELSVSENRNPQCFFLVNTGDVCRVNFGHDKCTCGSRGARGQEFHFNKNVTRKDNGAILRWKVEVKNFNTNFSKTITLNITSPPEVSNSTELFLNAHARETVFLSFNVLSHTLTITQCQLRQNIDPAVSITDVTAYSAYDSKTNKVKECAVTHNSAHLLGNEPNEKDGCECIVNGKVPDLTVTVGVINVTEEDAGNWTVNVFNSLGSVSFNFSLSVLQVETTTSAAEVTTSHGHHDITCTESRMEFSIPLSSPHTSETATLSDPNCLINVTRTHVRGGVDLNSCGTTVQFQNDSVIFRNAIIFSAPESSSLGSSGSNSSVSQYQDIIPIQCVYNRIATVHLSYMPVVRRVLFTESGVGQFSFNIQQFWDASFTNMVSDGAYPLRMELDADVFIQLSVGSEGQPVAGHKEIGMEVQQCLVSPSSSVIEAQLHYYPLIQDGCPASSDVHIIPNTNASDSTVMRFRFRAVNFFDPSSSSSSSLVFVHCRMGLCLTGSCKPSAWSCLTPPARRVRRDVDQSKRAAHQLSTGPFLIMADQASTSSSSTTATVMAVVSTSVATVAIVIAAIALIALRRRRTTERN